jgi:DNA invertase Pin-like site-specific DNA recombinase
MTGQRIGYKRVSTVDQSTVRQLDGVSVDKVFEDKASGKDTDRPQLQLCLEFLREGDTLVVHSMDRLARNLVDLRRMVSELTGKGIKVEFVKESLTFTGQDSPMANLLLSMLGAVAEFERALINERQREGIKLAKEKGVYRGRKPSLTVEKFNGLLTRKKAGETVSALCRESGISRETFYAYLNSATKPRAISAHDNLGTNPLDNRDDGLLSPA